MSDPTATGLTYTTGTVTTADGLALHTHHWTPEGEPRSHVAIVHGYADHGGRYAALAADLVRRGHAVHAYDQRGYGRSGGDPAWVASFDDYVADAGRFLAHVRREARAETPLYLLGHSMGGAVATLYCLDHPASVDGLVLSSPMIRIDSNPLLQALSAVISRLLPRLRTVPLDRAAISRDPAVVEAALQDPLCYQGRVIARTGAEMVRATRRIRARVQELGLPLLVIHGTADRLTSPHGSIELYHRARSTDKTLGLYEGLYHETWHEPEREQVIDEITQWLDEHAPA